MIAAQISARFVWLGHAWGVQLPTYQMVDNSVRPVVPGKVTPNGVLADVSPKDPDVQDLWCDVIVPDAFTDPATGLVDVAAVVALHDGQVLATPIGQADAFGPPTPDTPPVD